MSQEKYQAKLSALLNTADIQVNGERPWDMQVHNADVFGRTLGQGSLGIGEAYMEGWWDCEQLDEFFYRLINGDLRTKVTTLRDKLFYCLLYTSPSPRDRG